MSRREDRERAKKGLLYRSGKLVPKEEIEVEEASPEEAAAMIEAVMRAAGIRRITNVEGGKLTVSSPQEKEKEKQKEKEKEKE